MASKLISGDRARAAQTLLFRTPGGAPPRPQASETPALPDAEHAKVVIAQQARIQELERELEQRPRKAYQQGFTEGQTAGAQQAAARLEPAMAKLAESLKDLAAVRRRYLQEAEMDALKLALAVARRVLHRELTVDPESILGVVKAAIDRVDARDLHRVRVNPDDLPILQKHLAAAGLPARLEVVADPALERGGVLVETARGTLDASIGSQLKEIERGLVDLVGRP